MRREVVDELLALSPEKRAIVLGGLKAKLGLYERRKILSYRYDVCPVCQDVGSTEEDPKCAQCYIPVACKEPFNYGFRDDPVKGAEYFGAMFRFLRGLETRGRTLIVGGNFDPSGGKPSGVIRKLAQQMGVEDVWNGGVSYDLLGNSWEGFQTILWLLAIGNEAPKIYPKKAVGTTFICSKVMRPGYTTFDSVSRIFKMRGNAVIEIHPGPKRPAGAGHLYRFHLVDALGNEWCNTSDIGKLAEDIDRFVAWSRASVRVRSHSVHLVVPDHNLSPIVEVAKIVADKVENERGGRFFGNASTRCMAMFPSERAGDGVFVSARNVDKRRLTEGDFVYCEHRDVQGESVVLYTGDRKPSVDTPIQLELYERFPEVGCMIHGHAFVRENPTTETYYACGDLREVEEVAELMKRGPNGIVNLKNHGVLIYAEDVQRLEVLADEASFINVVPLPGDKK